MSPRKYPIPSVGDKFGELTVTSVAKVPSIGTAATLVCVCGKIVGPRKTSELFRKNGGNGIRSCQSCANRKKGIGYRRPNSRYSSARVLGSYKGGAKSRGIDWELTDQEFYSMIELPCVYCGDSKTSLMNGAVEWHPVFMYTGLDRIDSSKGYSSGNIQPCCKWCNYAKRDRSEDDFLSWVERVYNYGKSSSSE